MNIAHCTITIAVVLHLIGTVHGRVGSEYYRWAEGQFDIPPEIAVVTSAADLGPFLTDMRPFIRMAAVRRLSQIAGAEAIDAMKDLFSREPPPVSIEGCPLVKLEIIRVLDRLNDDRATGLLLSLLARHWETHPRAVADRNYQVSDFSPTLGLLMETLASHAERDDVFHAVERIARSDVVLDPASLHEQGRVRIWGAYLDARMSRERIVGDPNKVRHLLKAANDIYDKGRPAYLSLDHIAVTAIHARISRMDGEALSVVEKELSDKLSKREYRTAPDPARTADNALRNRGFLRRLIQERATQDSVKAGKAQGNQTLRPANN